MLASRLILLCAPAFAGKSTLAAALVRAGFVGVSLDEMLRARGLDPGAGLPPEVWDQASYTACDRIAELARERRDVVLDDTLCYRFIRDRYREVGARSGMDMRLVVLRIEADEIRRRITLNEVERVRPGIRDEVLASHIASFEWPGPDEDPLELDATKPLKDKLARVLTSKRAIESRRSSRRGRLP